MKMPEEALGDSWNDFRPLGVTAPRAGECRQCGEPIEALRKARGALICAACLQKNAAVEYWGHVH